LRAGALFIRMLCVVPSLTLSLALTSPLAPADPTAVPAMTLVTLRPSRRRPPPPPPPAPIPGETELVLRAQQIDVAEDGRQIAATGDVRVVYGPDTLTADRATADLENAEVVAEGSVTLARGTDVIHGERVHYNWETRLGRLEDARTTQRGVLVHAKELTTT